MQTTLAFAATTLVTALLSTHSTLPAPPSAAPSVKVDPAKPADTKPATVKPALASDATRPPNFIFIQAEATGWSSTSVDMDGQPPSFARPAGLTPNLEKLAADGMRFTDFYVTAPRCTPSRTSFVTGISPAKLHMTYQNEGGNSRREEGNGSSYNLMRMVTPTPETVVPAGVKTTGNWLGEIGYASAHFGKWHVGRQDPKQLGFDLSDGPNSNQGPERGVAPNPKQAVEITDKGIAFMREQVKAGKPFYLQLSHYGFGAEEEASPESLALAKSLVQGVSGKPMGAIAGQHDVDLSLGRVRAALDELGIAGNTYVFFSADHGAQGGGGGGGGGGGRNGGRSANPPFVGAKGSVSEGGIRVPFIMAGPGIEKGAVSRARATGMDIVPTLRDLAGTAIPKAEDIDARGAVEGGSLVPVLKAAPVDLAKAAIARPREEIVIHFPHYDLNNGGPASAIYLGDHKLVRNYDTKKVTLFDIAKDPGESNDLASAMPERVKELETRLDAYLKAVKAQMPAVRPDDGSKPAETPDAGAPSGGEEKPRGGKQGGGRRGGGQGGGGQGGGGQGGGGQGGGGQGGGGQGGGQGGGRKNSEPAGA